MSDDFLEYVMDQLSRLEGLRHRRMFGGVGVYLGDDFFAIVDDGRLYFKVDDVNRPDYEARGMKAFAPAPDMIMGGYYEVPVDVLEDDAELCRWATRSVEVQKRKPSRKKSPSRKRNG